MLRAFQKTRGMNQTELAKTLGVSPQFICDVFAGSRNAGQKIAEQFGYEVITAYRKIPAEIEKVKA